MVATDLVNESIAFVIGGRQFAAKRRHQIHHFVVLVGAVTWLSEINVFILVLLLINIYDQWIWFLTNKNVMMVMMGID